MSTSAPSVITDPTTDAAPAAPDPTITVAPADPGTPVVTPTDPAPVVTPENQVIADAQSVATLHVAYDTARDTLATAQASYLTVSQQAEADVAAAQALAAQKVAAAQAVVDSTQAAADAAHKASGDGIAQLVKDAQALS